MNKHTDKGLDKDTNRQVLVTEIKENGSSKTKQKAF